MLIWANYILSSDFEIETQDSCQVWVPDIEVNVGLGLKLKLRQPLGTHFRITSRENWCSARHRIRTTGKRDLDFQF